MRTGRYALAAVVLATLTACSAPGAVDGARSATTGSSVPLDPVQPLPSTPTGVGRFTYTAPLAQLSWTWRVADPQAGTSGNVPPDIPTEPVVACRAGSAVDVARSVYVPARLTVTYTGARTIQAALNRAPVTRGATVVAYLVDGTWNCGTTGPAALAMHSGESRTFPALVIAQILSHDHPAVDLDDRNSLAFGVTVETADLDGPAVVSVEGPGACSSGPADTEQFLYLYRVPPASRTAHS